jgi:uncharacterized damage-inducible protein DinB
MAIELEFITGRMVANAKVFEALFRGVSDEQARWKPAPESWSLLEVVNHLYDEEREDFRQRLDLTLHQPGVEWPPIDPQGWVVARGYNQRDLEQSLNALLQERQNSLVWLRSLQNPNWDTSRTAPWGQQMRAGDLLAAWLAHDHLHIRQMNELHYAYHKIRSEPYQVEYAGEW